MEALHNLILKSKGQSYIYTDTLHILGKVKVLKCMMFFLQVFGICLFPFIVSSFSFVFVF